MSERFAGRAAVVTGASKGIGRATAERLAADGARVVITARDAGELAGTAAAIEAGGGTVLAVPGSILEDGAAEAVVTAAHEAFGPVGLIVNVVGVNTFNGNFSELSESRLTRALAGNTWPTLALVRAGLAHGLGEDGSVVPVSSIGARQIQPMLGHYSAGKAALEVLVRHLARELGPRGIRVNAVAPGLVETDISRILWEGPTGPQEASLLPLQRLGRPEDIANAITFLLSAESAWITGVTLDVDGGRLLMGGESRALFGAWNDPEVTDG